MTRPEYRRCLNEALRKAFAAKDKKVRLAYFDLAQFYRVKACTSCPSDWRCQICTISLDTVQRG